MRSWGMRGSGRIMTSKVPARSVLRTIFGPLRISGKMSMAMKILRTSLHGLAWDSGSSCERVELVLEAFVFMSLPGGHRVYGAGWA